MKERRKPTSVLLHEKERLAADLYRACADGRIKDIRKIKPKFHKACEDYEKRVIEDMKIQKEKELKKKQRRKKIEETN